MLPENEREFSVIFISAMSSSHLSNVPVKLGDIYELCADSSKLPNYLLKYGLLGDYSGLCESCGDGALFRTRNLA